MKICLFHFLQHLCGKWGYHSAWEVRSVCVCERESHPVVWSGKPFVSVGGPSTSLRQRVSISIPANTELYERGLSATPTKPSMGPLLLQPQQSPLFSWQEGSPHIHMPSGELARRSPPPTHIYISYVARGASI